MQNEKVAAAMQDNVTQADRDRAFSTGLRLSKREWIEVYAAFAAHRLASTTAQTEAVQKLVEALEEIADLHGEINPSNYDHDDACELNRQFCYAVTTAAAALAAHRESQP